MQCVTSVIVLSSDMVSSILEHFICSGEECLVCPNRTETRCVSKLWSERFERYLHSIHVQGEVVLNVEMLEVEWIVSVIPTESLVVYTTNNDTLW